MFKVRAHVLLLPGNIEFYSNFFSLGEFLACLCKLKWRKINRQTSIVKLWLCRRIDSSRLRLSNSKDCCLSLSAPLINFSGLSRKDFNTPSKQWGKYGWKDYFSSLRILKLLFGRLKPPRDDMRPNIWRLSLERPLPGSAIPNFSHRGWLYEIWNWEPLTN